MTPCVMVDPAGAVCGEPVSEGASLPLCRAHLLAAYDEVAEEVADERGVTDVLPSPCLACGSRLGVRYPSGWLCAICEWRVGSVVDPADVAAVRVDVVYYIRFRDQIKIGTSATPRQRLAALRHDELLAFERGTRAREQQRHAQFAALRLGRSEWFAVGDDLLAHIDTLRRGIDDPWQLYALWRSEQLALRG